MSPIGGKTTSITDQMIFSLSMMSVARSVVTSAQAMSTIVTIAHRSPTRCQESMVPTVFAYCHFEVAARIAENTAP